MKKVGIWALVLTLLFLAACQPTPSPVPPLGDATTTATDTATTAVSTTTATDTTTATTTTTTAAQPVAKPKYDAVGMGMEKPENFVPDVVEYYVYVYRLDENGTRIEGLRNKTLQQEINDYIKAHETDTHSVAVQIANGYLSVETQDDAVFYDLYEGKRIAFTDLFFKGTELALPFRDCIRRAIQSELVAQEEWGNPTDGLDPLAFVGLKADHTLFSLTAITLLKETYHFPVDIVASIDGMHGDSLLSVARDMQDIFEDTVEIRCRLAYHMAHTEKEPLGDTIYAVEYLDSSYYPNVPAKKINEAIRTASNAFVSQETLTAWVKRFEDTADSRVGLISYGGIGLGEWTDRYFKLQGTFQAGSMGEVPYGILKFYDRLTGDEVAYDRFLKDGWKEASAWYAAYSDVGYYFEAHEADQILSEIPDLKNAVPIYMSAENGAYLLNLAPQGGDLPLVTAVIPFEYVDWSR